jgi:hypothetical protein
MRLFEIADEKDMEDVAFGNFKKSPEEDTTWESKVFYAVKNFINNADPNTKGEVEPLLHDLMLLKSKYPNDLIPKSKYAYRGTQLSKSAFADLAEKYSDSDKLIRLPYTYSPRSPVQSWTVNKQIGFDFAFNGNNEPGFGNNRATVWKPHEFPYPAVIMVPVDDSFIMNSKLTNKIAKEIHGMTEKEIIRAANTPIKGHIILHPTTFAGSKRGVVELLY